MHSLTIQSNGEFRLPPHLCERYGFEPQTPVRIIEMRNGVLLVPLTDAPMNAELAVELSDWQSLSSEARDVFPYEAHE